MAGPRSKIEPTEVKHELVEFACSGFFQEEYLTGLETQEFTSPIWPIFARKRFKDADIDYEKLKPTLRLASALLTAALPFFHAILTGTLETIENDGGPTFYYFPEPLETLTDAQETETVELLAKFAMPTRFCLREHVSVSAECEALEFTCGIYEPQFSGTASRILIDRGFYKYLISTYGDDDIVDQEYTFFEMASTLVHELAHAAVHAVTPIHLHDQPMFVGKNGKTSETGFELESYLFGGAIPSRFWEFEYAHLDVDRDFYSDYGHLITFSDYPCPAKVREYDTHGSNVIHVNGSLARTHELMWTGSFLCIHKMFSDAFWNGDFLRSGRKSLQFDRKIGYRFEYSPDGPKPLDPNISGNIDVPEGFWINSNGLIQKDSYNVWDRKDD